MGLEEELQLEKEWKEGLDLITDHEAIKLFYPNRKDKLLEILTHWAKYWDEKYFPLKKIWDQNVVGSSDQDSMKMLFAATLSLQWEKAKTNHYRLKRMIQNVLGADHLKEKERMSFAKTIPLEEIYSFKEVSAFNSKRATSICPFHKEKTGSFLIYRDQNKWHCYGECSEGGDSVDFIRKLTGRSTKQSVDFIIERYGKSKYDEKKESKKENVGRTE